MNTIGLECLECRSLDAIALEYLPGNIDYWSPEAPIAPRFFPYNRCNVWQCTQCSRLYLRYTEGGGYFVDRRIRAVHSALIKDVPL